MKFRGFFIEDFMQICPVVTNEKLFKPKVYVRTTGNKSVDQNTYAANGKVLKRLHSWASSVFLMGQFKYLY